MDGALYSLNDLRDIVVPEPPPWWPPAPGVWVVLAVVLVVAMVVFWRLLSAWKRNAYRRAGLTLLDEVNTARDVSVVLKRVALAVFPREQVASLYGPAWVAFLNATCSRSDLSDTGITDLDAQASPELIERAGLWIRHHRAAEHHAAEETD